MPVTLETLTEVKESPLLSELNEEELNRMAGLMDAVDFPKGSHVFEQDEEGDSLYIIASGQVGVVRRSTKVKDKERMLAVVGRGECVGEMALADGGLRSATIVALDPVKALELPNTTYISLRDTDNRLAVKLTLGICRMLSKRLRQIDKNLEIVHYWMFA
jgi:CRP-like cAMP-binding protein